MNHTEKEFLVVSLNKMIFLLEVLRISAEDLKLNTTV